MNDNRQRVNIFANKYLQLYNNPYASVEEIKENFKKECLELGFKMDADFSFIDEPILTLSILKRN
ncbi:MAG: hypothetical protein FD141_740 [Fusobacteria bacterium]|nr:MAG: hypothetical protein FD141_740 [Fusobacteriota bacterium]KAF0228594.1 MAG: hypothetical protein FD182_850 [Fusobacteriota bacterium]